MYFQVSIDCKLKSGGSCVSETASDGKIVPWAWYPKSECDETQKADITYRMCNNNDSGTIALNGDQTYAKFTGKPTSDSEFAGDLEPGCKEVTITEDLAKCKANPVGIQMSGTIKERTGKNGCYSYAFNKSRSKAIPTTEVIEARLYEHTCENCGNTSVSVVCIELFQSINFIPSLRRAILLNMGPLNALNRLLSDVPSCRTERRDLVLVPTESSPF